MISREAPLILGIGSFSPPATHHADASQGERQGMSSFGIRQEFTNRIEKRCFQEWVWLGYSSRSIRLCSATTTTTHLHVASGTPP